VMDAGIRGLECISILEDLSRYRCERVPDVSAYGTVAP
jgi:hypothetical protein